MPLENLISGHYSPTEKTAVETALTTIETTLLPKFKNLSAEERKKYGSVNEQNKLIVNKVKDYRDNQPGLSTTDVDWAEFQADFASRDFLQKTISRLEDMVTGLNNNKILHDFDNFSASLLDYGFSQYKAGTKAPGFENKVKEIGQFFNRTDKPTEDKTDDDTPTT